MPFTRPTLTELVDRIQSDLETRLPFTGPVVRRSVTAILATALGALVHGLYGFLAFLADQLFTATSETSYLERQAGEYGITREPATYASGTTVAGGTNGTLIPAGSTLQRGDGATYTTQDDEVIYEDEAQLAVVADVAGAGGNSDAATVLTFIAPIAGITAATTVDSDGLTNGADTETDDELRTRLEARRQNPPQGGSSSDYELWAKLRPGVTRVWVAALAQGAGTVTVRFVRDDDGTGTAIIPDSDEVTAVQALIDARRPVTAAVTVVAPVADALAFTIHVTAADGFALADVKTAVEAELQDLIAREAEPGEPLLLSHIRTAIGNAEGVDDYTLTLPAADVTHATGHMAVLDTITWV